MKYLQNIDIAADSREEILPDFSPDFPCLASHVRLSRQLYPGAPWHWHRTVELFYVESGSLEYIIPEGRFLFPPGSGGFLNANVLHSSRIASDSQPTVQLLHMFDPVFLAGERGSRIERKYILPLTAAGPRLLPLHPDDPAQAKILARLKESFALPDGQWGYELRLRAVLSELWLALFDLARPAMESSSSAGHSDALIKALMVYIHENYARNLSVDELAAAVHISRRACFRVFRENLRMTPLEYLRQYRLSKARTLLESTDLPITEIAYECCLGSSSYFGKTFREAFGCTPGGYRRNWHDRDRN